MPRIVSIWLRSWPIARRLREEQRTSSASAGRANGGLDVRRPIVLVAPGAGGARITALNRAALESGLQKGDLLSNALSKVRDLDVRHADPLADAQALEKLGLWCLRYTPLVSVWDEASGADGLFLDIEASAHLFGGEARLLADLRLRLHRMGLAPRLAIASTQGAGWALARYGKEEAAILPNGSEREALRTLPLAALRLPDETLTLARRLGLRRIGDIMEKPRAPLSHRFGPVLLARLDQALGELPEPLPALIPPPVYETRGTFAEPISSAGHIVEAARRLFTRVSGDLVRDDKGARALCLMLFRTDGDVRRIDVGLAAPTRDAAHIARLIELRLSSLADDLDAGLGFEAMGLHVSAAEPLFARQASLTSMEDAAQEAMAALIDRLGQRLGSENVMRLVPRESHIPERAVVRRSASLGPPCRFDRTSFSFATRPLLLLEKPEEAHVLALIPEGPPRQFRWRGVLHQVAGADGPERIAPEWWRRGASGTAPERDYYTVEDENGWRFWLYRAGRYGDGVAPRWFIHGLFA